MSEISVGLNRFYPEETSKILRSSEVAINEGCLCLGSTFNLMQALKLSEEMQKKVQVSQTILAVIGGFNRRFPNITGTPRWFSNYVFPTAKTELLFDNGPAIRMSLCQIPLINEDDKATYRMTADIMTPVDSKQTLHVGGSASLKISEESSSSFSLGLFKAFEQAQAALLYRNKVGGDAEKSRGNLTLKAATEFEDKGLRVAGEVDVDLDSKEVTPSFAVEKKLDDSSLVKFKAKYDDVDIAVRCNLNQNLALTFCFGMSTNELRKEHWLKNFKELE